jgi:acyl-CoA thioesterase FadM
MSAAASIRISRRIAWIDTDAAGIYHWNTIFRLAEEAEASLYTALGVADMMFGYTPRVAVEMRFLRSLKFNDRVEVELAITELGRSSIRYGIEVVRGEEVAAEGALTVCLIDADTRGPTELPGELRRLLAESGPQSPVD